MSSHRGRAAGARAIRAEPVSLLAALATAGLLTAGLIAAGLASSGCDPSAVNDDAAPAASAIPTAAYSAQGADYPPPGGGTGGTGVAACDAYFQKIASCKGIPASARAALEDHAKVIRESLASGLDDPERLRGVEAQCKAASEGLDICDTNL